MSHVRNPELASPDLPGNRPLSTAARVAALDCLLDDIGTNLTSGEADALIERAANLFERGDITRALDMLTLGCDYTGAYRIAAVLHTTPDPSIANKEARDR